MYEALIDYFLNKPTRLASLGRALFGSFSTLIIVGLYGRLATAGVSMILGLDNSKVAYRTLGDVYPSLPTWFVPETAFGFTLCTLVTVIGVYVSFAGRKLERFLHG